MNRRQFILSAAALAAIKSLPKVVVEAFPEAIRTADPALSFAALEMAYQSCVLGYDEPTVMYISPEAFVQLHDMMDVSQRFSDADRDFSNIMFHSAAVTYDQQVPSGVIVVKNERDLLNIHLNGMFNYAGDLI